MNKTGATKSSFLHVAVTKKCIGNEKMKIYFIINAVLSWAHSHWLCTSTFLSNGSIISGGMLFIWERYLLKLLLTSCTSKVNGDQFPIHSFAFVQMPRNSLQHMLGGRRGKKKKNQKQNVSMHFNDKTAYSPSTACWRAWSFLRLSFIRSYAPEPMDEAEKW